MMADAPLTPLSIPPMGRSSVRTASLYYYIRATLLAL
jgi:hypothetical protein